MVVLVVPGFQVPPVLAHPPSLAWLVMVNLGPPVFQESPAAPPTTSAGLWASLFYNYKITNKASVFYNYKTQNGWRRMRGLDGVLMDSRISYPLNRPVIRAFKASNVARAEVRRRLASEASC